MREQSNKKISLKIMKINSLLPHEQTIETRFQKLLANIKKNKWVAPILVDNDSLTILDGHHRTRVIMELRYKYIPAYLVDYRQSAIKVFPRKKNYKVDKKIVVDRATNKNLYPPRTTRHIIEIKNVKQWKIPLDLLNK